MRQILHTEFEKKALAKSGVKAVYDELENEFALINELIHARKLAHKIAEHFTSLCGCY